MILSTSLPLALTALSPAFWNCLKTFLISLWSFLSRTSASVDMLLLGTWPGGCRTPTQRAVIRNSGDPGPDAQKPRSWAPGLLVVQQVATRRPRVRSVADLLGRVSGGPGGSSGRLLGGRRGRLRSALGARRLLLGGVR